MTATTAAHWNEAVMGHRRTKSVIRRKELYPLSKVQKERSTRIFVEKERALAFCKVVAVLRAHLVAPVR